jgi:hypothetical protein
MKIKSTRTYLELQYPVTSSGRNWSHSKICNPLVTHKEVFQSTSGFDAFTSAFVVASFIVTLFTFLVTLDPIPYPNVLV